MREMEFSPRAMWYKACAFPAALAYVPSVLFPGKAIRNLWVTTLGVTHMPIKPVILILEKSCYSNK